MASEDQRSARPHHISRAREVSIMAASIAVEMESGVSAGRLHPHNGYYAGDFTNPQYVAPAAWQAPIPAFDPQQC